MLDLIKAAFAGTPIPKVASDVALQWVEEPKGWWLRAQVNFRYGTSGHFGKLDEEERTEIEAHLKEWLRSRYLIGVSSELPSVN